MRKFGYGVVMCGLSLFLFAGCKQKEEVVVEKTAPTRMIQETTNEAQTVVYEPMTFSKPTTEMLGFTANEEGNLYVLDDDGVLIRYGAAGEVEKEYPDCLDYTAFSSEGDTVYAYDAVKHQVVALDVDSGEKKIVTDRFYAEEVLKIGRSGENLYILIIQENYQSMAGENEYHDYGECLYRISLKDGKKEKLPIKGITALYVTEDESVYYYAYQGGTYVLCSYDTVTGESSIRYDMMEQFGIKYVSAFVFEQGVFSYAEFVTPCIRVVSLRDKTELKKTEEILVMSGNDMDCVKGNVLYFGYMIDGTPNCFECFYVESPY